MKHLQVDGQRVNHVLLPGRHNSQTCSITQKQTEKLNLNIKNIMSICHIDIIYIIVYMSICHIICDIICQYQYILYIILFIYDNIVDESYRQEKWTPRDLFQVVCDAG